MNKIFSKIVALCSSILLLVSCNAGNSNQNSSNHADETFTITWKNWDNSVLEVDNNVPYGSFPSYDGPTPTRENANGIEYNFYSWTPQFTEVTEDKEYKAVFSESQMLYKIIFDLNGGSSPSYNPLYNASVKVPSFTRDVFFFDCVKEEWNFRGWSYNGVRVFDENGNQYTTPIMSEEMTFVAMYAQTAKLKIFTNMPEAGSFSGEGEYEYYSYVDVSAQPNTGYAFVGWYYENSLLSSSFQYKYVMWDKDVTLEARFKIGSYCLEIVSNNDYYGAVLLQSPTNTEYRDHYQEYRDYKSKVKVVAYTKSDVRFLGWYDSNNSLVSPNSIYEFNMPSNDYYLQGKWNYFTVTYYLNYGTNNPNNTNHYTIDDEPIKLYEPARNGYEFLGWQYNGNYVYEINPLWADNIILEARWRVSAYTIIYELDGGTNDSSNPSNYTIESDTIILNNPSKLGYSFLGWYKDSSFTEKITRITKGSCGDLVLYAKWEIVTYSINYFLNDGVNSPNNPSTYTVEEQIVFFNPSRTGYSFLGWYDSDDNLVTSIQKGTTGSLTLYAKWNDGDEYLITLDPNGGILAETTIILKYNKSYSLPMINRDGCIFLGWYNGATKIHYSGIWKYTDIYYLVAKWDLLEYTIDYELNGGTNDPSNPSTYNVESEIVLLDPLKPGYTFLGWYNEEGTQIFSIEKGSFGNIVLSAHWNSGNEYVITLNPNGGSIDKYEINVKYCNEYSLPIPTRKGYTFVGWYDDSDLIESEGIYTFPSNKTFVAHWEAIFYTITYIMNGGTNVPANYWCYTIEMSFDLFTPYKTGYSFLGWYMNGNPITAISEGTTGDLTIEARWSANLNNLNVVSEDVSKGTVSIVSGTGYSDESITVSATPLGDYIFKGWYSDGKRISTNPVYAFVMPTNDYLLIAKFYTAEEEEEERYSKRYGTKPVLSDDLQTLTYGLYPQKCINDLDIVSTLNSIETPESNGWYFYDGDYYAKAIAAPFSTYSSFNSGSTYWFKCEPISWKILQRNNNEYLVVANDLLDVHCYNDSNSNRVVGDEIIYPYNYQYSSIREWLIGDFFNLAFNLGSDYLQNNRTDSVFLLSEDDYLNEDFGFPSTNIYASTRCCKVTDWAIVRGAVCVTESGNIQFNGSYWIADCKDTTKPNKATFINPQGSFIADYEEVTSVRICARPAVVIRIDN